MVLLIETCDLDTEQVLDLYHQVGWSNYTSQPNRLMDGITKSLYVLAAFDDDKIVGILRAVGDGVTILFIQDILVLPVYQRQGIGKALLEHTIDKFNQCYQVHLLTESSLKTKSFYESVGFKDVTAINCVSYTYLERRGTDDL